ncbi:hypothetical protein BDZ97DRAFT_1918869 [Flammula alnicola]|nr:hypothetical protein BDZ97DRAFT_1918869 [Flammula alnicola]
MASMPSILSIPLDVIEILDILDDEEDGHKALKTSSGCPGLTSKRHLPPDIRVTNSGFCPRDIHPDNLGMSGRRMSAGHPKRSGGVLASVPEIANYVRELAHNSATSLT